MTPTWICRDSNRRLIIIFLGWGADASMVANVSRPGYDILTLYDYRSESIDLSFTADYDEICVIAWSFGVMEASRILGNALPSNVTLLLAVNGTERPIDDRYGIPCDIFRGTLANLNERNLRKFYRRMFSNKEDWERFNANPPQRPLDELTDELRILGDRAMQPIPHLPWTKVLIGNEDLIFPTVNQEAWSHSCDLHSILLESCGHAPDWQSIINHNVVDKEYVARRFGDASSTYDVEATLQQQVATRLWSYTEQYINTNSVKDVLEIGSGSGVLTNLYLKSFDNINLVLWDIAHKSSSINKSNCAHELNINFKQCDAEIELNHAPTESLDMIISSSTVQWFHSPEKFLRNSAAALRRGGILAFSTYGSEMCAELRQAGIKTLNYINPDSQAWKEPDPHLQLIFQHQELMVRQFDSPCDVFRHLRQTGVNALRRTPLTPAAMRHAIAQYPLDSEGKATLTFNPVYFIYRKR